jgi:hypothetical protein
MSKGDAVDLGDDIKVKPEKNKYMIVCYKDYPDMGKMVYVEADNVTEALEKAYKILPSWKEDMVDCFQVGDKVLGKVVWKWGGED